MTDSTGLNFYLVKFSEKPDFIYVLGKDGYISLLNKHKMNHSENIILKIDGKPDGPEFDIIDSTPPPPPPPPPGGGAVRIRMVRIPLNRIPDDNLSVVAANVAPLLNTHDANTPVPPQASIAEIVTLLQKYLNEDKKGGKKISLHRKSSSSRRRRSTKRRTASRKQQKRRRGSRRAH